MNAMMTSSTTLLTSASRVSLNAIDLDTSIQCRAKIDMMVVNDYAERSEAGDVFPPVDLYGTPEKYWIGDGWHRVLAANSINNGYQSISANLHPGGRAEALQHALGANTLHGQRRSNADKRKSIEIALREFPQLSNAAVSFLCGVDDKTVAVCRPVRIGNSEPETRTGQDGKQYPARREPRTSGAEPASGATPPDYTGHLTARRVPSAPSNGMQMARIAIMKLEEIRADDSEREQAFDTVLDWITGRRTEPTTILARRRA